MSPRRSTMLLVALVALLAACGEAPPSEVDETPAAPVEVPAWAKVAPEQLAAASKHGVPVAFENDLGMRFVLIPEGSFRMGSPVDETDRDDDEFQHEVTISEPFYLQITEVTKGQYLRFDPWYQSPDERSSRRRPKDVDGEDQPACVSHIGGRHFATWLSAVDDHRDYRLPEEVEWEYACRAGTTTAYWWDSAGGDVARYENLGQADRRDPDDGFLGTAPVAQFRANPWGLYDMAGNVSEVCVNPYEPYPDADEEALFRHGDVVKRRRGHVVRRGGSCRDHFQFARSAWRDTTYPDKYYSGPIGFRLVSPLPEPRSNE